MSISMTCEQFEAALPQLLDDAAEPAMTPVVREHLDRCGECRTLFDDLQALRVEACALPPLVPSRDLWAGIAARIEAPVVPMVEGQRSITPRRHMTWRTAGIAAAALIALNLGVTWELVHSRADARVETIATAVEAPRSIGTPPDTSMTPAPFVVPPAYVAPRVEAAPGPGRSTIVLASNVESQPQQRESARAVYNREITRLRAIVDSGRNRLDPATVAILERNLRVIDNAIDQCNEALARDAASTFLVESLNNAYQTHVKLLRLAAAAASRG